LSTINKKVVILDYGSGNIKSVFNMAKSIVENVIISNDISDIKSATHLILPGVGAFPAVMKQIQANLPLELLSQQVKENNTLFLGICVGMQVLAEVGFEFSESKGLGVIPGRVEKMIARNQRLPHIGWNNLTSIKSCQLLKDITDEMDFYFVHSFQFIPTHSNSIYASAHYGEDFCAVVNFKNVWGVQFHPEKSQQGGNILLNNFIQMEPTC